MRKEREFRYYSDIHSIVPLEKGFLRKRNPVKAAFLFHEITPRHYDQISFFPVSHDNLRGFDSIHFGHSIIRQNNIKRLIACNQCSD